MSGVHHVRHAANALVQATSSVVHGAASHLFREAEQVEHFLKPAGFSGQLPAVLQPASWRSLPAGYLPRDFIESPLTMVIIVDVMVVKRILLSTVGVHLIFKMLNFCPCTSSFIPPPSVKTFARTSSTTSASSDFRRGKESWRKRQSSNTQRT